MYGVGCAGHEEHEVAGASTHLAGQLGSPLRVHVQA